MKNLGGNDDPVQRGKFSELRVTKGYNDPLYLWK